MNGRATPVVKRYREAYRVGGALVGLGTLIKLLALVFAGIIFFAAFRFANGVENSDPKVLGPVVLATIVGVLSWVCGVMVAALGQILTATLDNAVASSHFLTDSERAEAMGLPHIVANRSHPLVAEASEDAIEPDQAEDDDQNAEAASALFCYHCGAEATVDATTCATCGEHL
jgi:hypothetical protein